MPGPPPSRPDGTWRACRAASSVAFHQSAGFCSDQPGCGRTGSTDLAVASPSALPARSMRMTLTPGGADIDAEIGHEARTSRRRGFRGRRRMFGTPPAGIAFVVIYPQRRLSRRNSPISMGSACRSASCPSATARAMARAAAISPSGFWSRTTSIAPAAQPVAGRFGQFVRDDADGAGLAGLGERREETGIAGAEIVDAGDGAVPGQEFDGGSFGLLVIVEAFERPDEFVAGELGAESPLRSPRGARGGRRG